MDEMRGTCRQCGAQPPQDSVFCPNCGARLEAVVPASVPAETAATPFDLPATNDVAAPVTSNQETATGNPAEAAPAAESAMPSGTAVPQPQSSQPFQPNTQPQYAQSFQAPPQPGLASQTPPNFVPQGQPGVPPQGTPVYPSQTQAGMPQGRPVAMPGAKPAGGGKGFPFYYVLISGLMIIGLLYWAFCIFLYPNYEYPVLTEDAQRWLLFAGSVVLVVWNLSMRIRYRGTRKRIIPNILAAVIFLVILYGYGMIEMTPDDTLHQFFAGLTSSIFGN